MAAKIGEGIRKVMLSTEDRWWRRDAAFERMVLTGTRKVANKLRVDPLSESGVVAVDLRSPKMRNRETLVWRAHHGISAQIGIEATTKKGNCTRLYHEDRRGFIEVPISVLTPPAGKNSDLTRSSSLAIALQQVLGERDF